MDSVLLRRAMQVVWPAFMMAGVAELVFFAIFDPFELHFFGQPLDWSREAIYALGFFGFWGLGIASSTLTLYLTHTREPGIAPAEEQARR
jgi:hypothetical protein